MDSASRELHSNDNNVGNRVHPVLDVLPENIRALSTFITKRESRIARFLKHDHNKRMLKLQTSFDAEKRQLEALVCQLRIEIAEAQQTAISFSTFHTKPNNMKIFEKSLVTKTEISTQKAHKLFVTKTGPIDSLNVTIRRKILVKKPPPQSSITQKPTKPSKEAPETPKKAQPKIHTNPTLPPPPTFDLPNFPLEVEGWDDIFLPLKTLKGNNFYTPCTFGSGSIHGKATPASNPSNRMPSVAP